MKLLKIVYLLLFFCSTLLAQQADFNISKIMYGDEYRFISGRMLALGGSGLAGGEPLSSLYLNPALGSLSEKSFGLQAGFSVDHINEDRAYPYYDSFNGFNDFGSYVYNKNWYNRFYASALFRIPLEHIPNLTISLGYAPFMDFSYDYYEEVGNPNRSPEYKKDKIVGYNSINSSGILNIIPFGLSFKPLKALSLGIQAGLLQGAADLNVSVSPRDEMFTEEEIDSIRYSEKTERTLGNTPVIISCGVLYSLNEQFTLAAIARLPYQIKWNLAYPYIKNYNSYLPETTQTLTYPLRFGGGLDYQFTNILQARLSIDIIYDFWSKFEVNGQNSENFIDTYAVNVGIEHIFFNNIPLRAGYSYRTLKEGEGFTQAVLSIGSGWQFRGIKIDLAAGISSMEYFQSVLFDNSVYGLVSRKNQVDRVSLSEFYGRINIGYAINIW